MSLSRRFATAALAVFVLYASCGDSGTLSAIDPPPSNDQPASECDTPKTEWIWCDDFDRARTGYFESDSSGGSFVRADNIGFGGSAGMRVRWNRGQVSAGSLHLAIGVTPSPSIRPVDSGTKKYREIFWRVYLRNQAGWVGGGGNKLSRVQILATPKWAQAMVAPVWSGTPVAQREMLMIDPASGTDQAGNLRTTQYNDVNLRYLGAVVGATRIFSSSGVDHWYCIEAHAKLNDAGQANGEFDLWIDDREEAQRRGLNWVGSFTDYGINAVFLENYWNQGSPEQQERYLDRFVVSTSRIHC